MVLAGLRKDGGSDVPRKQLGPLLSGIVLSGGNPFFVAWWATTGLSLATQAADYGALAFALFAFIHWLCDLVWLQVLSTASYYGAGITGRRCQRFVQTVCGLALLFFGCQFLYTAVTCWRAAGN